MILHDYKVGLAYVGIGSASAIASGLLRNIDAISSGLHVTILVISLITAILGLRKAMIPVTKNVSITLTPDQLNFTVHAIEQLPYKIARPILDDITKQITPQLVEQETPSVEQPRRAAEGSAS